MFHYNIKMVKCYVLIFLISLTRFIIKIDSKYYGSKKTKVKNYNSYL